MSVTLTSVASGISNPDHITGNKDRKFRNVVLDNSYPTGGYAITAANVGLKKIQHVAPHPALNDQGAGDSTKSIALKFNYTTGKLQAFVVPVTPSNSALVEVANATDLSTYSARLEFIGY